MPLHERLRPPTLELPKSRPSHGLGIGVAFAVLAAGFAFAMPRALQVSDETPPPEVRATQSPPSESEFGVPAEPERAPDVMEKKVRPKDDESGTDERPANSNRDDDEPNVSDETTQAVESEGETEEPKEDPEVGPKKEPARSDEDDFEGDSEDDEGFDDDDSDDDGSEHGSGGGKDDDDEGSGQAEKSDDEDDEGDSED